MFVLCDPKRSLPFHRGFAPALLAASLVVGCAQQEVQLADGDADSPDTGETASSDGASSHGHSDVGSNGPGSTSGSSDAEPEPPEDVLDVPFAASSTCAPCHPVHYEQWKASMHAFGGSDPVMLAMRELAEEDATDSALAGECLDCHAPALSRLDKLGMGVSEEADAVRHDGIGCDVCHSIAVHPPPLAEIGFLDAVDPSGPKRARIQEPTFTPAHESQAEPGLGESEFCGPCHQVNFDDGRPLENTFNEWRESEFGDEGVTCQLCHMPGSRGPAAVGGPERRLHDHRFTAMDYALEPYLDVDVAEQKAEILRLLQGSLSFFALDVPAELAAGEPLEFLTRIGNAGAGHAIPSGTAFSREIWVAITLHDALGRELYASGRLAANGDLVSDPDLVFVGAKLFDATGEETMFSWRAASIDSTRVLEARGNRETPFRIPLAADVAFPLTLVATLRVRPIAPKLVRALDLERLLPIDIFDVWQHERTIELVTRPAGP